MLVFFDKLFKLWQQGDYDQAVMDQVLRDLHKSFSMLSQIEQRYANLFTSDIQSWEVRFDPIMTFRDYIAKYMRKAEDARIDRIVRRLGCYEDLLRKLLRNRDVEKVRIRINLNQKMVLCSSVPLGRTVQQYT